ncbi:MAG: right-handed parallel beta-helix repeat-containing protein [Chloroflexota bacterium]|nr:right-handed parallel beta-helix repeat-containing protein [Chloroflexota bacterium]
MSRRRHRQKIVLAWLLCFALLLPGPGLPPVYADPLAPPAVIYQPGNNTIYIGSDVGAPASQPITVPELAAILVGQGLNDLVVAQNGGAWLIKANMVISTTAQVAATNATMTELRLDSPPTAALNITTKRNGHLLIDGIKVVGWENGALDTDISNQRSYLLAFEGGRMDILTSEVSHLGWFTGEPSGLSWRKRLNVADPTTGATGSIKNSNIHDNLYGMYSFEAYGIQILNNEFHNNIGYGIDPHDDSRNFLVELNRVHHNGNHGIIFSRLCRDNIIRKNIVYDNALHGIMLDRGTNNNIVAENEVYNNNDGIVIFQSRDNMVYDNFVHNNLRGVRINATFIAGDEFDDVATNNQIRDNQIEDSAEYGIYLYARADRNIIADNTIVRSGISGIYIKSGGNLVEKNIITNGGSGVSLLSGDNEPPLAKPALDPPGSNNVVINSTIELNSDTGVRIKGGVNNRIGSTNPSEINRIRNNGSDGVVIDKATNGGISTDNQVLGNIVYNNKRHGISIKDVSSVRNRLSQNSITGNVQSGIRIDVGAQGNIQPPVITKIGADGKMSGTTVPNALVEVYTDPDGEGEIFRGSTTADGSGAWTFAGPAVASNQVRAIATDSNNNTSRFTGSTTGAVYTLGPGIKGQTTITVTGEGATVTLADIQAGLGNANNNHLVEVENDKWQLNANLFIGRDVTLNVSPTAGVTDLRLRSQPSAVVAAGAAGAVAEQIIEDAHGEQVAAAIDYASFVFLRTQNGTMNLDDVKVYSWDATANNFDTDVYNGRAYVLAKYDAVLNIRNSELMYLGSADGESYGVSWRDTNEAETPDVLQTRVTGQVLDSEFHHNYYGIYTFQATTMVFRGNQFYENVLYGFDPHDFTNNVLVENNQAYNNGSHGFIISRGCNNFTFRNNKSYNNLDLNPTRGAQGFMLDPGSPPEEPGDLPQSPSYDNILEGNEAYGNEGFGLRILGSVRNQVLNNNFHDNQQGIVVDRESPDNTISGNRLTNHTLYGLVVRETADRTTINNNTIELNQNHGIYLRSNANLVMENTITGNLQTAIALLPPTGQIAALVDNQIISNTLAGNGDSGLDLRNATQTLVQDNMIENNSTQGIYLSNGASQNSFVRNVIRTNKTHGIRANGTLTLGNLWSENQIYANLPIGILLSSGANQNLPAPQVLTIAGNVVSGLATPGVTVELFSDQGAQGQFFEGRTTAADNGSFSVTLAGNGQATNLTAIAIDGLGNASAFSTPPLNKLGPPTPVTPTPVTPAPITPTPVTPTPVTPSVTPTPIPLYLPIVTK